VTPEIERGPDDHVALLTASTRPAYVTPEIFAGDRRLMRSPSASTRPAYVTPEISFKAGCPTLAIVLQRGRRT